VSSASGAEESPKAEASSGFAEAEAASQHVLRLEPGTLIQGRYELQREVGVGGLGAVWSARHLGLDQDVALKFLKPELSDHAEAVSRFSAEARACFVLRSEHVVRVLDVDSQASVPFIVMELLEGIDLRQVLEEGGLPEPAVAVDYALQVCEGLCAAHASGIVHRDIKPENLFLHSAGADPCVKVLDFGISQVEAYEHEQPGSGAAGTPPYMSPEQLSAATVDPRSDVWSLGCVLYELFSGAGPFDRETLHESCAAVLDVDPPALDTLRADLPPGLSDVVARCLRKDPAQRYADAAQLAAALVDFGTGRCSDYPERCLSQLRGERRSSAELSPVRDASPPTASAIVLAAPVALPPLQQALATAMRKLQPYLHALRLRYRAAPRRNAWLAVVTLLVLGSLSWLQLQHSDEPHVVTPGSTLLPTRNNLRVADLEAAAAVAPVEVLPIGAAAALEVDMDIDTDMGIEEGKAEPKVLEHSAKRRRHSGRSSRYQRRHAQRDPDVGF
jgi:serine/threonine protein kinase